MEMIVNRVLMLSLLWYVNRVLMLSLLWYEILLQHASVVDLLAVIIYERKMVFCTCSRVLMVQSYLVCCRMVHLNGCRSK
jgi:hypothetical protein